MAPKETGKEYQTYGDSVRSPRILHTRRRPGPVTRQISPLEAIRLACVKGDLIAVQNLIEGGKISVNCLLDDGWTPLMVAANAARPAVLEYLLLKRADPSLGRKDNFSALMAAATSCQQRPGDLLLCITLLLKAGVNVNAQDNNGLTALGYAVKENNYKVAKSLVEAGADVNLVDKSGKHSLFYAAEKGFGQVARLLLEHGADIGLVDKSGWMVGEMAVQNGHFKLGELLFRVRESCWRPGKSPALMRVFNSVPKPVAPEPDTQLGSGIVSILSNLQAQVKSLSNLINSVRLRMFQDASTKEYEVEPGKLGELLGFAKQMGQSCAFLGGQVSSLNVLLGGDVPTVATATQTDPVSISSKKPERNSPLPPPRRRLSSGLKRMSSPDAVSTSSSPPPPSKSPTPSLDELPLQNTKSGYIYSNYYSYYRTQQQLPSGWNILMAGATVSVLLVCCVTPQIRTKIATMRLWRI